MPRDDKRALRPSERHVGESFIISDLEIGEERFVRLMVLVTRRLLRFRKGIEFVIGVSPQGPGHTRSGCRPLRARGGTRKGRPRDRWHEHVRELKALRLVDGHELDGIPQHCEVEGKFDVESLSIPQPAKEGPEGRGPIEIGEVGRKIKEC